MTNYFWACNSLNVPILENFFRRTAVFVTLVLFLFLFILSRNVMLFDLSFIQSIRPMQTKLKFSLQHLAWISHPGMKFGFNVPSGSRNMSRGSVCRSTAEWLLCQIHIEAARGPV
jgi:hypothetical protein